MKNRFTTESSARRSDTW